MRVVRYHPSERKTGVRRGPGTKHPPAVEAVRHGERELETCASRAGPPSTAFTCCLLNQAKRLRRSGRGVDDLREVSKPRSLTVPAERDREG